MQITGEGFWPRWITASEFSIILQIIQKLNCSLLLRNSAILFSDKRVRTERQMHNLFCLLTRSIAKNKGQF